MDYYKKDGKIYILDRDVVFGEEKEINVSTSYNQHIANNTPREEYNLIFKSYANRGFILICVLIQ